MSAPLRVSPSLARRDAVAGMIVRGLEGGPRLAELRRYATTFAVPPDEVDAIGRRIAAGIAVAEACERELAAACEPLERALAQGALLFRAGLFFEAHEVLEAAWRQLEGAERAFVQGLIQIAVGMHHLGHDNPRGAAALFAGGRAKLTATDRVSVGVEVAPLLASLGAWESAAAAGRWPASLEPPPLVVRTSAGRRIGEAS